MAEEVWALVAPVPRTWTDMLAAEGIHSVSALYMAAGTHDQFTRWVKQHHLVESSQIRSRVAAAGIYSWQSQIAAVNPGLVVAFRGDGSADPDRCAAGVDDLPA